jgi:hypothetical protein
MDARRMKEKLNICSLPTPMIKKIKTQERKETASIPTSFKLTKAFLNGFNVLVSKFLPAQFPWKILGRGLCLQQTDITHKQNYLFRVTLNNF